MMSKIDEIKDRLAKATPEQRGDNLNDIQYLLDEVENKDKEIALLTTAICDIIDSEEERARRYNV